MTDPRWILLGLGGIGLVMFALGVASVIGGHLQGWTAWGPAIFQSFGSAAAVGLVVWWFQRELRDEA